MSKVMEFKYKDIMGNLSKVEYMQDLFDLVGDSVAVYEVNRKIVDKGLGVTIGGDTYMILLEILKYVNDLEKIERPSGLSFKLVRGLRLKARQPTALDDLLLETYIKCSRLAFERFDSQLEIGMYVDLYRSFHRIASIRDPKGAFKALLGDECPFTPEEFLSENMELCVRNPIGAFSVEATSPLRPYFSYRIRNFDCKDKAVTYKDTLMKVVKAYKDYKYGVLKPIEPTSANFTSDNNTLVETPAGDLVNSPKHYEVFQGIEAKEIIECVLESGIAAHLTSYQYYCLGNVLKYRLRAGSKDDLEQDIAKANKYKEMGRLYE